MGRRRETIQQDIRYALRTARKSPGFVLAAAGTLALGIGATTAIFSILSGVLLRPLPFARPDRLVQLNQADARNSVVLYFADMDDWRKQSRSFEAIAAYGNTSKNLLDIAEPERIQTLWAERSLFRVLGVAPIVGRTFAENDATDVVVLSASLWKRRFGADPACIGRKINLNNEPFTIIGVMPETFQFPYRASLTEMWIPWSMPPQRALNRNSRTDSAIGRLRPGVTLEAARQELNLFSSRLAAQFPATNQGRRARIMPLAEVVGGPVRAALLTLLGAVGLLLLIACANVANLLLARAARRTHEIAVRTALGASRSRVIQQLLTESVLLSLAGGFGGLFLAVGGARLILKFAASQIPRSWEVGIDWRVFCFLLATCAITGIAFGILPALAASRTDPQMALKQTGGNRSTSSRGRMRDALVVAEIALSFVLLASAGLLMRGFLRLQDTPAGFVADNVLTLRLTVSLQDYRVPGSYGRYLKELESRVKQTPSVRAAGFIQYLPLQNWGWNAYFSITGRPVQPNAEPLGAELRYVSPGYFEALRIPLRRGRLFTDRDTPDVPAVIVVNEALARRYFPNQDPVGQRTDRGVILGVVGDVRTSRLDLPSTPEIYYSFVQNPAATSDAGVSLVVSSHTPPETLVNSVRDAIHQANPHQAVYDVKTMQGVIANSLAGTRLYLWLIGWFAGLALLLAASGVYGVISYVVAARTQEFGIRLALGAEVSQILLFVLRHGGWLVACGLVIGVAGTLAAGRLLQSLLSGVNPADPAMLAAAASLLAAVALAACLGPARRATRVDPMIALKYE
jgi:predicted permease